MQQATQKSKTASFEKFVKPAENYTTYKLNEAVKLRIGNAGLTATKPITLPKFFRENCEKYAQRAALSYESTAANNTQTNWITLTYTAYAAKVEQVALMLLQLGLVPQTGVGILAHNCPEWLYVYFAAIQAGGVAFGIYQTSSPDAVHHMLKTADATICIVDDAEQMEKVRLIHKHLPKLRAVIQLNGPYAKFVGHETGYYKWHDLLAQTNYDEQLHQELQSRESEIYANQCAVLVFTSGTTGFPKAVMLSHDNLIFSTRTVYKPMYDNLDLSESFNIVSYLPLSHIAGQTLDIFCASYLGAHLHFADRNAMRGTLLRTMQYVRPRAFFGVPRIYEKFQSFILAKQNANTEELNVKQILGLDRCKWCLIGAAPVLSDLKEFYLKANMLLFDVYGLSEIAGIAFFNFNSEKLSIVGKSVEGVEIKIVEIKQSTDKREICLRGRNVFMGYLQDPAETLKSINPAGWLHTGDIGCVDEDGDLMITGRLKELIITSGGENIPFPLIESTIKAELPMISNALLVGDQRKYLTVLLTFKTELDASTALTTDDLPADTIKWLRALNLDYTKITEIFYSNEDGQKLKNIDTKIVEAIEAGLQRANARALSHAQRVQKFRLLPHDFSIPTGELGPTLKTRRGYVLEKYAGLINEMYK